MAGAGPPSRISVVAPSRSFSRSFLSHHIWFGPLPPPKKKSQIKTNRNDIWLVEIVSIEWKWKWKEKRNQTGSRESLSGGRCLCKQKKNIQCGGAERMWGGGSQLRDYLLPRRLAFQFYYIQRALPTQRDDDNNNNNTKTSSGFSPLAIYPFMCVLFYSYTDRHRAAAQSAQGCFFFCTRGNPAGKTRESFEMIRDGPSSVRRLAILQTRVFTSLSWVSPVLNGRALRELRTTDEVVRAFQRRFRRRSCPNMARRLSRSLLPFPAETRMQIKIDKIWRGDQNGKDTGTTWPFRQWE
jgi:hypothetical protein